MAEGKIRVKSSETFQKVLRNFGGGLSFWERIQYNEKETCQPAGAPVSGDSAGGGASGGGAGLSGCGAPAHPAADRAAVRASGSLLDAAQVDLNTAGLEALCTLPGIGESKARAIIEDRAANGPYAQVEDVTRVSGITRNTIKDWVRLAYVS